MGDESGNLSSRYRVSKPFTAISGRSAGVDVDVNEGEIVCLIGANGAGKSTLMMTICGSPQARTGSRDLRGTRHHPHADA